MTALVELLAEASILTQEKVLERMKEVRDREKVSYAWFTAPSVFGGKTMQPSQERRRLGPARGKYPVVRLYARSSTCRDRKKRSRVFWLRRSSRPCPSHTLAIDQPPSAWSSRLLAAPGGRTTLTPFLSFSRCDGLECKWRAAPAPPDARTACVA